MFGSEVYRFLKESIKLVESKTGSHDYVPGCTVCGKKCCFWTPGFREEILKSDVTDLKKLYNIIENNHQYLSCFVDGSKTLKWYRGSLGDYGVITCKHPLRLLASYFYNERSKFKIVGDSFSDVNESIVSDVEGFITYASDKINSYVNVYNKCLNVFDSGFICKVDELHVNYFSGLNKLCTYLGESSEDFSPCFFSEYSAHPVGGNKAPHWQFLKNESVNDKEKERHTYYKNADSVGDYKLDNKFEKVLPLEFVKKVSELDCYKQLCVLLGYDEYPITSVS